jgi:hypothetical protein
MAALVLREREPTLSHQQIADRLGYPIGSVSAYIADGYYPYQARWRRKAAMKARKAAERVTLKWSDISRRFQRRREGFPWRR